MEVSIRVGSSGLSWSENNKDAEPSCSDEWGSAAADLCAAVPSSRSQMFPTAAEIQGCSRGEGTCTGEYIIPPPQST